MNSSTTDLALPQSHLDSGLHVNGGKLQKLGKLDPSETLVAHLVQGQKFAQLLDILY